MPEREKIAPLPWHVPVALDEVPEEGQHFDLAADAETRAAAAQLEAQGEEALIAGKAAFPGPETFVNA